jgi:cell migration-inducing and hyaluronan-binding protein
MYEYWTGYAGEQVSAPSTSGPYSRAGLTPLQEFFHNSCSTAMTSVQTVGQTSPCFGVALSDGAPFQKALISTSAPTPGTNNAIGYYPNTSNDRFPTICSGTGCNTVAPCAAGNLGNCAVTVLDHFTSAFNWAQENYSAIWLRINW